jgi:protein-histidine pros-kinase
MPAEPGGWARLLDALPAAVVHVDPRGRPVWSNAMARRIAGAQDPLAAAAVLLDVPAPEPGDPSPSLADVLGTVLAAGAGGEPRREAAVRLRSAAGVIQRDIWVSPVPDERGGPAGAVAVLSAEEERLQALLENTSDIIVVLEHDGTIRFTNPAADRLTGYVGRVMSGTSAFELVHPDDQARALDLLARRIVEPDLEMPAEEIRVRHGDGSWRHMLVKGANLLDEPTVGGLVVTLHDITDRKVAESRFRALVEQLSDVIVIMDANLRVTYVSPAVERITGAAPEDVAGSYVLGDIHPEDLPAVRGLLDELLAEPGAQRKAELRVRRVTPGAAEVDHWRRVEVTATNRLDDPAVGGIVGVVRDVTELRQAQARFRDLVDLVPDAMVLVDTDGAVVLANRQVERLFGYLPDELVGRPVELLVPEPLRSRHRSHRAGFAADPRTREMGAGIDLVARRHDGSEIPVEISLAPLDTDEGLLIWAAIRDVTERRVAQEALRTAYEHEREAAEQLRKLDALKDEFLATASHELRSPLTVLAGYGRLLAGAQNLSDSEREMYLGRIVANVDAMISLVEQLLDHSRLEAGRALVDPRPLRVLPVLQATLGACADRLAAHRVTVAVPEDLVVVADPDGLGHVLRNLLTNAAKFSAEGSTITVSAARIEPAADEAVADEPAGGAVADGAGTGWLAASWGEIRVTDEGPGIDPEEQAGVFERFRQASSQAPPSLRGSGLGLNIARRYAELQGGYLGLDSEPGRGSTFYLRLPLGG